MSLNPLPEWPANGAGGPEGAPGAAPSRAAGRRASDREPPRELLLLRERRTAGRGSYGASRSPRDPGHGRLRRAIGGAVVLVVLAALYLTVGPSQIGGPVTYVVTAGSSMQPMLHRGDLAIVRKRDTYAVRDVVLYRSQTIHENVLHRIIGRNGQLLVTRGDNNDYDDPENPSLSQVRGELWFHVPRVGGWLKWFQEPIHAALLLGLLVVLAFGGGGEVARRRGRRPVSTGAVRTTGAGAGGDRLAVTTVAIGAGVAAALFAVVVVVASGRPETRTVSVPRAYVHEGSFSWSASTWKSVVYPDGRVRNGEPVFTRLVRDLDVAFAYHLEASPAAKVFGGVRIDAVVSDNAGWRRTLPVARPRPFDGDTVVASGTLDVKALVAMVNRMQRITGSSVGTYRVTLEPHVEVSGVAGTTSVDDTFAPSLALTLDRVALRLDPAAGDGSDGGTAADPAAPATGPMTVTETHDGTRVEPVDLDLGPVRLGVEEAKRFGLLGLVVSLLVTAVALALGRPGRTSPTPVEQVVAEHSDRVVSASVAIGEGRSVTDLADLESLLQLAERYDRVVLHEAVGDEHVFVVDDGFAVYRCRVSGGTETTARMAAART